MSLGFDCWIRSNRPWHLSCVLAAFVIVSACAPRCLQAAYGGECRRRSCTDPNTDRVHIQSAFGAVQLLLHACKILTYRCVCAAAVSASASIGCLQAAWGICRRNTIGGVYIGQMQVLIWTNPSSATVLQKACKILLLKKNQGCITFRFHQIWVRFRY